MSEVRRRSRSLNSAGLSREWLEELGGVGPGTKSELAAAYTAAFAEERDEPLHVTLGDGPSA
jgi:hypothetical protein